jgi:ketosteroid isomerase-like protein
LRTVDLGDTVLAEITMAGRGASSGLAIEQSAWHVSRFRNDKLASSRVYGTRAEALEAVGLSEQDAHADT